MPYREPARTRARRPRSTILAVLVVVSPALGVVLAYQALASSAAEPLSLSSSAAAPLSLASSAAEPQSPAPSAAVPKLHGDRHGALGEADGLVPHGVTVFDDELPAVTNLDPDLLGALRRAATDAADDGVEFLVNSGWRTPEYQEHLLHEAVSQYGSEAEAARWVATADKSLHVSGDAVDIGPSGAAAWLSEHGAEYGLCQIYRNEPWHYELRPEAIDDGCPPMYANPTHDPRLQQ